MVGLDDLHDQLDDAGWGEELAALLPLRHGELPQEILVNLAEGIALDGHGDGGEVLQQRDQQVLFEVVVGLGQNVLEVFVLGLDRFHGRVDGLADIGALWEIEQSCEPSFFGEVQDALSLIVGLPDLAATGGLLRHLLFSLGKLVIGVAEEDQPENRDRILGRLQLGVRPEFVGGVPETFLKIRVVCWHGSQF